MKRTTWGATAVVIIFFICNVVLISVSFLRNGLYTGIEERSSNNLVKKVPSDYSVRNATSIPTNTATPRPLPVEQPIPNPPPSTKRPTLKPNPAGSTNRSNEYTSKSTPQSKGSTRNTSPKPTRREASPILVLHIGPHKTGTSTIQCDLSHYRNTLYRNASVVFMGRVYGHCVGAQPTGVTIDTRGLINTCFKSSECTKKGVWKNLEAQLGFYSSRNESVIISDEAFSRMRIIATDSVDNRAILYNLFQKYYPDRIHVVIMYRRYYEWMQSIWNEGNKPHLNSILDPNNPYKDKFKKWPSEGGKTPKTFRNHMSRTRKNHSVDDFQSSEYQKIAEVEHVHVAEYLRRLWSNFSSEVVMLNMHEMRRGNDGEDITTRFVRELLPPLASDTLRRVKESGFVGRPNPSRNFDYDRLAVKAHEQGLLVNLTTVARFKIAEMTENYLLRKLNTTINNLPLVCLDKTQLQDLLEKSIRYENQIYPGQSKDVAIRHESSFFDAVERKKFCNFDTDKLIQDDAVRTFFTDDIPQLLRSG